MLMERVTDDLFERFFRISNDLFVVTNGHGRIEHVNPRWASLLGYRLEEVQGRDVWEFIHPDDFANVRDARVRLFDEKTDRESFQFEARALHKQGSVVLLSWTGSLDPETKYFYGVAKDITQKRMVENELAKNRQLFETFMDYSPNVIYLKDRDGRFLLVNSRFKQDLKHLSHDFLGKTTEESFPEDIAKSLIENDLEVYRTGVARTFEEQMIHEEGMHIYLSSKFPLYDAKGEINGVGGVSTDITDLVHEREDSGILRKMIESSNDGFGYCAFDLKPIYLNRYLTDKLGWSLDQENVFSHFTPESLDRITHEALPRILNEGLPWEGEVEVDLRDAPSGEPLPVYLKMFCSYRDDGKPNYIGFFAVDQKQKKITEIALLQNAKMASLGEMAAGVAHEVNNPITIIHGTAALMKRAVANGELNSVKITSALERIERTALRISKIIRGLRTFSRSGQNDPFQPTSLSQIFDDTIDLCQERFRNHAIDLRVDSVPDTLLRCRPTQIAQVLLNLLSNAADAVTSAKEKWIQIKFSTTANQHMRISITDSGPGIPEHVRTRVMEPFFTTKAPGSGTGLGLPISQGILEEHGGSLSIDPDSPHTCFVIEIPLS